MKRIVSIAALSAAPFLIALVPTEERVQFSVAEGLTLEKSFVVKGEMKLTDYNMLMNGNPPPMEMEMDITSNFEQSADVTDEYPNAATGRPSKLKRTFNDLAMTGSTASVQPMGSMDFDLAGSSALEGFTVIFDWNEEAGLYDVTYDEAKQGDAELLDGLEEDMDLRSLLPTAALSVGDTYEIAPKSLLSVLAPGGNLRIQVDDAEARQATMGNDVNMADVLTDLTGTVTGELLAVREVEGRKIAIIRILVDVEGAEDMTSRMQDAMDSAELPEGMEMQMSVESADLELAYKLEGELHWDLAGGHFVALELKGEATSIVDMAMSMDAMGQQMNIENTVSMGGTSEINFTAARR